MEREEGQEPDKDGEEREGRAGLLGPKVRLELELFLK